jgi:hypothetical protein
MWTLWENKSCRNVKITVIDEREINITYNFFVYEKKNGKRSQDLDLHAFVSIKKWANECTLNFHAQESDCGSAADVQMHVVSAPRHCLTLAIQRRFKKWKSLVQNKALKYD